MHVTSGAETGTKAVKGWRLRGADAEGRAIELFLDEETLWRSHPGISVGRHAAVCNLTLAEPTVSRRHFRVSRQGEGLLVEDLNSLNGTFLDGRRLAPFQPAPLVEGQTLVVGHIAMLLSRA